MRGTCEDMAGLSLPQCFEQTVMSRVTYKLKRLTSCRAYLTFDISFLSFLSFPFPFALLQRFIILGPPRITSAPLHRVR